METSLANDLHDAALQGEKIIITAKLRKCWNLIELEKHGLDIYD